MIFIECERVCATQPSRAGLTCAAPPALRKPVEELVPGTCERQKPGAAVVEVEGGAGEWDLRERVFVGARMLHAAGVNVAGLQNRLRDFVAKVGRHGHAVTGVAEGEVEAVELASMGQDVEGEIERAAPDVFDFGIAQLRIDREHAAAKNFCAASTAPAGFGK